MKSHNTEGNFKSLIQCEIKWSKLKKNLKNLRAYKNCRFLIFINSHYHSASKIPNEKS